MQRIHNIFVCSRYSATSKLFTRKLTLELQAKFHASTLPLLDKCSKENVISILLAVISVCLLVPTTVIITLDNVIGE